MEWVKGRIDLLGAATILNPGELVFTPNDGRGSVILENNDRLTATFTSVRVRHAYVCTVIEFPSPVRLSCGVMKSFFIVGYPFRISGSADRYWDNHEWKDTVFEEGEWSFELQLE